MRIAIAAIGLVWTAVCAGQMPTPGTGIERTMSRLAASTAEKPETVRVLFYGQSITKQNWWREVASDLRARYPSADLKIENRAIGGYSTQFLIRTMEADILPFHPDLIVFHDYGEEGLYEEIVRWIRSHTTAEILLQNDHVAWLPGEPDTNGSRQKNFDSQEKHSSEWMPSLARKYGLGLVDLRRRWHEHLQAKKLAASALLRDSVHLNEAGERLYAKLTMKYLVAPAGRVANDWVREIVPVWKGGRLDFDFDGNRVEAVGVRGAALDVSIDGKRPGELGLFYHSRPTNTWDADWPTVRQVGHNKPLQVEDWVLKVTQRDEPGTTFSYEVYGGVTGFDGAGTSTERFVSRSGRVVLEVRDYDVERSYGLHKIPMPGSWQIRWSSLAQFVDPLLPGEGAQTIVYGLQNGRHHLTLIAPKGVKAGIDKIRIYRPPLKENP